MLIDNSIRLKDITIFKFAHTKEASYTANMEIYTANTDAY